MAPKRSEVKWLTIKWVGNNSRKYDGVVHLIDVKHVHPEDVPNMAVGNTIRVKWGGRTWRGEVVVMPQLLLDEPVLASPVPQDSHSQVATVCKPKIKPSSAAPKRKQCSSSAPKAKTSSVTKPRRPRARPAEQPSATKRQRTAKKGK